MQMSQLDPSRLVMKKKLFLLNFSTIIAPIRMPTISIATLVNNSKKGGMVPEVVCGVDGVAVLFCVGKTTRYPFI